MSGLPQARPRRGSDSAAPGQHAQPRRRSSTRRSPHCWPTDARRLQHRSHRSAPGGGRLGDRRGGTLNGYPAPNRRRQHRRLVVPVGAAERRDVGCWARSRNHVLNPSLSGRDPQETFPPSAYSIDAYC